MFGSVARACGRAFPPARTAVRVSRRGTSAYTTASKSATATNTPMGSAALPAAAGIPAAGSPAAFLRCGCGVVAPQQRHRLAALRGPGGGAGGGPWHRTLGGAHAPARPFSAAAADDDEKAKKKAQDDDGGGGGFFAQFRAEMEKELKKDEAYQEAQEELKASRAASKDEGGGDADTKAGDGGKGGDEQPLTEEEQRAQQAIDDARAAAEAKAAAAKESAQETLESLGKAWGSFSERAREAAGKVGDKTSEQADAARERLDAARKQAETAAQDATDDQDSTLGSGLRFWERQQQKVADAKARVAGAVPKPIKEFGDSVDNQSWADAARDAWGLRTGRERRLAREALARKEAMAEIEAAAVEAAQYHADAQLVAEDEARKLDALKLEEWREGEDFQTDAEKSSGAEPVVFYFNDKGERWDVARDPDSGDTYYYVDADMQGGGGGGDGDEGGDEEGAAASENAGEVRWERPGSVAWLDSARERASEAAAEADRAKAALAAAEAALEAGPFRRKGDDEDGAEATEDNPFAYPDDYRPVEGVEINTAVHDLVMIKQKEGTWAKFQKQLGQMPLIQSLNEMGERVAESEAGQKVKAARDKVSDTVEDAREYVETSQNPWVYKAHGVYDSMFAESEMGEALREIREADPTFNLNEFMDDMTEHVIPRVMHAFVRADKKVIEEHCSGAAAEVLRAHLRQREHEGHVMDPNILNIQHITLQLAKVVEKRGPMIVLSFVAQQLNCVRDKKTGEIVDGDDTSLHMNHYMFAVQQEYDEHTGALDWKVVEFVMQGSFQMLV